jgi:PLP dependent protein
MNLKDKYQKLRSEIPDDVEILLAAKKRTKDEVVQAIDAGVKIIGENYLQDAEDVYSKLGEKVKEVSWHMIGHLQKNKINKALKIFDVLETIDSVDIAEAVNKRTDRIIQVYIEINSGREPQKSGVMPEQAEKIIREIALLPKLKVKGLMTMGPRTGDPEKARPFLKETKRLFDELKKKNIPNVDLKVLSMGMSNSYNIAIEEGSNLVRLGTIVFGQRPE